MIWCRYQSKVDMTLNLSKRVSRFYWTMIWLKSFQWSKSIRRRLGVVAVRQNAGTVGVQEYLEGLVGHAERSVVSWYHPWWA